MLRTEYAATAVASELLTNPVVFVGILVFVGGLVASLTAFIATRGTTKATAKERLDARIDARVTQQLTDAWAEIDGLKKTVGELESTIREKDAAQEKRDKAQELRDKALIRILLALAHQWVGPGPKIDPMDIAIVEDLLPEFFIRHQTKEG